MPQSLALTIASVCLVVSSVGSATTECPPETKTKTAVLGGKEISQTFVRRTDASGQCVWMFADSQPERYTTEECQICFTSGGKHSCVNFPTALTLPPCKIAIGPDCNSHVVDPDDQTKTCVPGCWPESKTKTEVVAGKEISQTLVNMRDATGRCVWVLPGSKSDDYRTEYCGRCRATEQSVMCVGSGQYRAPPCGLKFGPDCQLYKVDPKDSTKMCDVIKAT